MTKKFSKLITLGFLFSTITTSVFAVDTSTSNTTPYQAIFNKVSTNVAGKDGEIVLDEDIIKTLTSEEQILLPEVIEDLSFLYQEGNIFIDEESNLQTRSIEEIAEFTKSELEANYITEDGILPIYDPDKPSTFSLQSYVNSNTRYLQDYYDEYVDLMIKYPSLLIMPQLQTEVEFASKVAEGQPWDYKRYIGWNNLRTVKIDGKEYYITGEDIGNIHYGYVGRDLGFSTSTLCKAGGLVQVITSRGGSLKQFSYDSYYDDPTDQAAIKRGTSWFDNGSFK